MSGSLNRVQLIGYLGKDPEIRHTQDGRPIANFSVATSESWKDKNTGEKKERTEWHNVVVFNEGLCKIAEQYLKKGKRVFVEGAMQTRKWMDQQGTDRYSTEVVLRPYNGQIIMLSTGGESRPGPSGEDDYGTTKNGGAAASKTRPGNDMDDEIPFAPEMR